MQYVFLICTATDAEAPQDEATEQALIERWVADNDDSGARLAGNAFREPSDATTVKVRAGETLVTAGPFAETTEWIAGFDLIEADDLDAAIAIASKHPMARRGQIDIRPLLEL